MARRRVKRHTLTKRTTTHRRKRRATHHRKRSSHSKAVHVHIHC